MVQKELVQMLNQVCAWLKKRRGWAPEGRRATRIGSKLRPQTPLIENENGSKERDRVDEQEEHRNATRDAKPLEARKIHQGGTSESDEVGKTGQKDRLPGCAHRSRLPIAGAATPVLAPQLQRVPALCMEVHRVHQDLWRRRAHESAPGCRL